MYFIIRCILTNNPVLVFYEVYFKITKLRNRYSYVFESVQLELHTAKYCSFATENICREIWSDPILLSIISRKVMLLKFPSFVSFFYCQWSRLEFQKRILKIFFVDLTSVPFHPLFRFPLSMITNIFEHLLICFPSLLEDTLLALSLNQPDSLFLLLRDTV